MRRPLALLIAALASGAFAAEAPAPDDLVRIAEAQRLVSAIGESVWPGWQAPFTLLLVTEQDEFLTGLDPAPAGFAPAGHSALLGCELWTRPRQFEPNLLATFPAFGSVPVIVIGRAEATKKTSVSWVLTVAHEHFHQYQMSDPRYYAAVNALGLAGDDQTGMWMLNYPFPYDDDEVGERFAAISKQLAALLRESSAEARARFWRDYRAFLDALSEQDARYLRFQIWQEGVSRYVELRVAEAAAVDYAPSVEFAALPDASAFSDAAKVLRAGVIDGLTAPDLAGKRRVSFYAFGAGLSLLLDMDGVSWKDRYLTEKFRMERYATRAGD